MVSIITPLYNNSRYISLTIESVLAQTYKDWELLIVDDGSDDGCADIVSRYAQKDKRIKLIRRTHQGSAAARNHGIRQASGRYIALLDSDDIWEPNFLECQIEMLNTTGGKLVCSAHRRIDETGKECLSPFYPPLEARYEDLLRTCSISCLTALYDTEGNGKIYLREDFKLRDDYILWLDIIKKVGVVYGNQKVLASYRITSSQKSANKLNTIIPQYKVYRQVEQFSVLKSLFYLTCWAINGIIKYIK